MKENKKKTITNHSICNSPTISIESFLVIVILTLSIWVSAINDQANQLDNEIRTDTSAREATGVTLSKYSAAAGGILEVTATVTGYQGQDQSVVSRYDIWAETGEEIYYIARNRTASTSEIIVSWLIPTSIPTGSYRICTDQEFPHQPNLPWNPYSYSESCSSSFSIKRYDLLVSYENPMPIPGEEFRVHALVSSALDGAPESPEFGGWEIEYATISSGVLDSQRKTGIFGMGSDLAFTFLLPSNIVESQGINIQVWANGSGGDQVETVERDIKIGSISVNVQNPESGTVVVPDDPFILSLNSYRHSYYDSYPEAGMSLNVDVKQGDVTKRILSNVQTDGDGYSSNIATLISSTDISDGPATIFVSWTDPADMSIRNVSSAIFISTGALSSSGGGMGIDLTARISNEGSEPGDVVMLVLETRDDYGMPLPNCWIQYQTMRTSLGHDLHAGVWQTGRTNSLGLQFLNFTIPSNLNPAAGDYKINVIAWNETGVTDTAIYNLQIINPDIELMTTAVYWLPGDTIMMGVDSTGMDGKLTGFWSVDELDLEGIIEFDSGTTGTFSFTVPTVINDDTLSIAVITLDARGSIESDSHYIQKHTGISVTAYQTNAIPVGGGKIDIAYSITQLDPESTIEYPVKWHAMLSGVEHSEQSGKVNQTSGTIQVDIPDTVESGTYILIISFDNAEVWGGYQIVEVRSESDGTGISGALASTNDAISPSSPIISVIAIFLGLLALVLSFRSRNRSDRGVRLQSHELAPDIISTTSQAPPPPVGAKSVQRKILQT